MFLENNSDVKLLANKVTTYSTQNKKKKKKEFTVKNKNKKKKIILFNVETDTFCA